MPQHKLKPPLPPRLSWVVDSRTFLPFVYNHPPTIFLKKNNTKHAGLLQRGNIFRPLRDTEISSSLENKWPGGQVSNSWVETQVCNCHLWSLKTLYGCQGNSQSLSKCAYVCKSERESICASWNSFSDACICSQGPCQLTALFHLPILRYNIHPSVPSFLPLFFILLP